MSDPWQVLTQLTALFLGTFASEDLTSVSAGLLIRDGRLDPTLGVLACFLGIYVGDLGLWLLGRWAGRSILRWKRVRQRMTARRWRGWVDWFERRSWAVVLAARFLPATRLPIYLLAGACGRHPGRFIVWSFLAAAIWTPLLVLGVAHFGNALAGRLAVVGVRGWPVPLITAVVALLSLRLLAQFGHETGRARIAARLARLWRWEFWPSWLFYLPLVPWLAWLALRYRSLTVWTAANPGIPQGGVVGESKFAILSRLPRTWTVPSVLVDASGAHAASHVAAKCAQTIRDEIEARGWTWPIILKPDASQRGAGVRLLREAGELEPYLTRVSGPVLAQPYHPGPFEAGIFYYRIPGERAGHVFSITDKLFPAVVGDGMSTLEQLIWRHPRYRMQAATFLARHKAQLDRVPHAGESIRLAVAGNHCQGTMFRDGRQLITHELEATIDAIARQFPGFYIGRFDVRYSDVTRFRAGCDLAIVELNGVTSESTNIYDPTRTLWSAYRILYRQWELLFRIGNANRRLGIQPCGLGQLARLVCDFYRNVRVPPLAD